MGPPSKPAERPLKESDYDVSDSLAGTGINIREEESNLAEYYAGTYGHDAKTGFPVNAPGDRGSFFGSGLANQTAQPGKDVNQKVAEAAAAERAWNESAVRLATQRAQEQNNRFLQFATVHFKADKIAKEYGLTLNLDQKNPQGPVKARNVMDYPPPKVTVQTSVGPDGAMVATYGSILPPEAYLIDQLALLSLAAKQRIRELVEDADKIATTRQQTSHGAVPAEWADAAAPLTGIDAGLASEASPRTGVESAVSPRTNPLKRSFEASQSQNSATEAKATQNAANYLAQAMREIGKADRDAEEARLRKRQKRQQGDVSTAPSRAGSVAPATPGSVAPEPEKAPTKKELKKNAQAKLADASNAANVNRTTMAFLGGMGKKKGKSYSWMSGGGASGASTPSKIQTQGLPGTPGATPSAKAPEDTRLTQEGRHKLGTWREYSEKGKNVQLRDWVVVLERDGREKAALQFAYDKLDESEPK
ncbi:putative tpa inducible protein [Phaeoacremonium minimum UCRPA7]|uniref:Putative tpa inducible protein n=1 Tax=Phaeoacremonium minimum (strain UCR-PA7) TaxID=1286976 RepID=R8BAC4_PHAM7|nr:putative tpa inducible protein [Phaeoacremonium minimum UCRPA7]EON96241.1 putative tpa inducible protein [Phaeoacremonium minimum UCRPA7]